MTSTNIENRALDALKSNEDLKQKRLIDQYKAFKANRFNQFFIALRRSQADELRRMLALPDSMTLNRFNSEVWQIGYVELNGQKVDPFKILNDKNEDLLEQLETMLKTKKLIYHGNSIWGSGSRIYAPGEQDEQVKMDNIFKTLEILNTKNLPPQDKAEEIMKVHYFGQNTATGLVMVYHPLEFAIYNKASEKAMNILGYKSNTLEDFEESIRSLKELVVAEDYIELDWFLYLLSRKHANRKYPFKNEHLNYEFLQNTLKKFNDYRDNYEEKYQKEERQFKEEIIFQLGPVLRRINKDPDRSIDELVQLLSNQTGMENARKNVNKLLSSAWVDDFLVILEQSAPEESADLLKELFDHGITEQIRKRIEDRYYELQQSGKMNPNKRVEPPNHLLAMLLASYRPDEYTFYRPDDFAYYVENLGLTAPNDVVERYALYNQLAHYIREYGMEQGYNVKNLMDAYHVVYLYMSNKYPENTGGSPETMTLNQPTNKILYGPPGTGKTYSVITEALKLVSPGMEDQDILHNPERRDEAVQLYKKYIESNQIMFCTFHQSYSYEDFVEGIRFNKDRGDSGGYEVRDGIFKRICNNARSSITNKRKNDYNFDPANTNVFKMSLGYIYNTDDNIFDYCIDNNVVALGWGDDVDFTNCSNKEEIKNAFQDKYPDGQKFATEAIERFKHKMDIGDIVVISSGNTMVRAIGKITGPYRFDSSIHEGYMQFRDVEWLVVDNENMIPVERVLKNKIFSQQSIYQLHQNILNVESLKELLSGHTTEEAQYVLIIDEINRGNISKIFGELITLIEPDKRMGQENELPVTLPYSDAGSARFSVPSNVHLLGTMNTADRSIALLDTALRRRFDFKEMMPEYDLLPEDIEGINIRKMLQVINERIEYLYDRDHQIGHAYFLTAHLTAAHVKDIMLNRVIPLLQEYFYENWESIELVLGGAGKNNSPDYLLNKKECSPDKLFKQSAQIAELQKFSYTVQKSPSNQALIQIYEHVEKKQPDEQEEQA